MSSITKNWTVEDFRKELRKLDQRVKETQGIELVGAELDISFFKKAKRRLGEYHLNEPQFRFSLFFFNSDVPEACAIDVIRHEYAHYYTHVVFGKSGHGAHFKTACQIVGANPSTYYSSAFENRAREKEKRDAMSYESSVNVGKKVLHPTFGEGVVVSVANKKTTAFLTVDFRDYGTKIVDEKWLDKNGVI